MWLIRYSIAIPFNYKPLPLGRGSWPYNITNQYIKDKMSISNIFFGLGVICLISVVGAPISIIFFVLAALCCWGKPGPYNPFDNGGTWGLPIMPSITKIKIPEIEECHRTKEECLCVTCRWFSGSHTKECEKKRCRLKIEKQRICKGNVVRICKGNVVQCKSYERRKDGRSNKFVYDLLLKMDPENSWMEI